MTEEFVTLKELAPELGLDRSNARKYVLRQGIKPKKRRTADSGGQLTLTVSAEEAAFLKRTREEEGFLGSAKPAEKEVGEFYAIQLVPELAPNRIKLDLALRMLPNALRNTAHLHLQLPFSSRGLASDLGKSRLLMPFRSPVAN